MVQLPSQFIVPAVSIIFSFLVWIVSFMSYRFGRRPQVIRFVKSINLILYPYIRFAVYAVGCIWATYLFVQVVQSGPSMAASLAELMRGFALTGLYLLFISLIPGLFTVYFPNFPFNALLVRARRAIGVSGLDYHIYNKEDATSKKDHQKRLFAAHIALALKYDLPLIMHCRDAYEDFFDVIDSMPTLPRGVIHCFSGGLQELRFATDRNLYVGIDGNVTYSKQLGMVVPSIPSSMLLLETDAPYLTPVPHRGKRNEPKYIPLTAAFIATLQNSSVQDIASNATKNAQTLFRLG